MEQDIKELSYELRAEILKIEARVNAMHKHSVFEEQPVISERNSEMHANIMLAYRHLEDARMRLGKVVQAYDGGTSVYPR